MPSAQWFKPGRGFVPGPVPYILIEILGVSQQKTGLEVDWGGSTSDGDFLKGSFLFGFGGRLGFEFRGKNFGVFFDVGFRYYSPPKDDVSLAGDVLALYTIPIRAGVAFYFGATSAGPVY